jgi:hypothetical protein
MLFDHGRRVPHLFGNVKSIFDLCHAIRSKGMSARIVLPIYPCPLGQEAIPAESWEGVEPSLITPLLNREYGSF